MKYENEKNFENVLKQKSNRYCVYHLSLNGMLKLRHIPL